MRKIRVLIVDDSIVIRRLLKDILAEDPEIEIVGTAANGRIALAKIPQLKPDLLTLDIEMPELDGLSTLPLLRKDFPKLPVIMFSTLSERGAVATLDALALGANDYVTKPANVGSIAAGIQSVRSELIPKIKSLCPFNIASKSRSRQVSTQQHQLRRPEGKLQRCNIVVIGSSTGGPQALSHVIGKLPSNFPAPIVVVQHMPPMFTRQLASRLDQDSALEVVEAKNGDTISPGKVLIAPGDFHLEIKRQGVSVRAMLNQAPHENSCRPAVDFMFRSAAKVFGPNCQAVVLTGMGQDGRTGAKHIVDAGGSVIVQDESTCVVWGMPRAVAEAGLASHVCPLDSISNQLICRVAVDRHSNNLCESC